MTEERATKRFVKLVIERFSIISTIGFIVSGFVNAFFFYFQFNLNYFDIASPSDIVMSGFRYISVIICILAFLFGPMLIREWYIGIANSVFVWTIHRFHNQRMNNVAEVVQQRIKRMSVFIFPIFPIFTIVWFFIVVTTPQFGGEPIDLSDLFSPGAIDGLYLTKDEKMHDFCGDAPVLWLGSGSAIIDCHDHVRVVQRMTFEQDRPIQWR